MFERFTENARQAIVLATDEARRFRHPFVGTEHILLGLLRHDGLAAEILNGIGVTLTECRDQVEAIEGYGPELIDQGQQLAFTPRTKKALELALREALSYGHNYVGTEHLLLGLVRERDGVAASILEGYATAEEIRSEVVRALSRPAGSIAEPEPVSEPAAPETAAQEPVEGVPTRVVEALFVSRVRVEVPDQSEALREREEAIAALRLALGGMIQVALGRGVEYDGSPEGKALLAAVSTNLTTYSLDPRFA